MTQQVRVQNGLGQQHFFSIGERDTVGSLMRQIFDRWGTPIDT